MPLNYALAITSPEFHGESERFGIGNTNCLPGVSDMYDEETGVSFTYIVAPKDFIDDYLEISEPREGTVYEFIRGRLHTDVQKKNAILAWIGQN